MVYPEAQLNAMVHDLLRAQPTVGRGAAAVSAISDHTGQARQIQLAKARHPKLFPSEDYVGQWRDLLRGAVATERVEAGKAATAAAAAQQPLHRQPLAAQQELRSSARSRHALRFAWGRRGQLVPL